ncbi:MAG: ribonuclease catalytic domain-containing protein [Candidatus Dadabacteria bacterium]|nr:ribonuclease catalytic domain-containing protein [Candidatus Dadabacteria bacterium]MDE0476673.1 ribonuclease catalytic domain-containing protein [Candidatus Dadabacteria bacterium]
MNLPSINELVAYRKRREPALGVVLYAHPDKLSVLSEDGKRYSVEPKKVVLLTGITVPETLTDSEKKLEMRKWRRELEEKKDSVDMETLWECVVEEQETVSFEEILELYSGAEQVSLEQRFLLFWAVDKNTVYLARSENGYLVRSREDVSKTLRVLELREEREQKAQAAVSWVRSVISGEAPPVVDETHGEFLELIERYVIDLDGYERAKEAKGFLYEAGLKEVESAVEFLIKTGFWKKDDDPESKKIAFHFRHSQRALEEVEAILSAGEDFASLTDRTDLEVFSVDSETTQDIDDAISFETHGDQIILGVHISNVAHVVSRGSFIDQGALDRAETVYFPEGRVDMFPRDLVNKKLSLTAGDLRPALSLFATFKREDFTLIDYSFEATVIRISKNLTYAEATEMLRNTQWGEFLVSLTDSLRGERINKGALIVQLPELKIRIGDQDGISVSKDYMDSPAHNVVSECMILMNRLSADFFDKNGIPALFRSQTQDIEPEARELDPEDVLFPVKVAKHLKPSFVAFAPEVHKSLGVSCYVQMTSPIRRYTDLLMQRQLISWLEEQRICYSESELEATNTHVSLATREIKNAQRGRHRYWLIRYLLEKDIKGATGYVSSRGYSGFNVYIPEFLIELPLSNSGGRVFDIGSELSLSIWGTDPLRRRIRVSPT